jgi:hypothetical protein
MIFSRFAAKAHGLLPAPNLLFAICYLLFANRCPIPHCRSSSCLSRFFLPIPRWCIRLQRMHQATGDFSHTVNRGQECSLIGF